MDSGLSFDELAVAWVGAETVSEAAERAGVTTAEMMRWVRQERANGVWLPELPCEDAFDG